MFKNSYQNGLLSIFYSCGANPLALWEMHVKNGHIKRLTDTEVNSIVLEIVGTNVATTYMICPRNNQTLGIKLPFLVMIVKNLKRYFSFEITILDDKNMRRRFRISNFQSTTKIKPFCTSMPIGLSGGWNQIQFNLSDFTRRAYGTQFIETLRVQVHANVRIRRIYFAERLYTEEELPQDYKLYLPLGRKQKKGKEKDALEAGTKAPLGKVQSKKSTVAVTPTSGGKEEKPSEGAPLPEPEVPAETPVDASDKAPAEAAEKVTEGPPEVIEGPPEFTEGPPEVIEGQPEATEAAEVGDNTAEEPAKPKEEPVEEVSAAEQ